MNGFMNKIEKGLVPLGQKLQSITAISALAETMQAAMPIIIIGSFATLFTNIDIGPWQSMIAAIPGFTAICGKISALTSNAFSLYALIILTYIYGRKIGLEESVPCLPVAVAAFFIISPLSEAGDILANTIGMQALVLALLIGILTPVTVKFLLDKGICIRMPKSVPKFAVEGFSILIPGVIVCALAGIIDYCFTLTPFGNVQNFIYSVIQYPLTKVALSFWGFALLACITSAIMWPGLHSGTVMGLVTPLLIMASGENQTALLAGENLPHIIEFEFLMVTCVGGQACLLIPCLIGLFKSRSKQIKEISKVGIVPAIFGIGEPILFGMPCMFNALMFIPMVLSTFASVACWYIAISTGLVGCFSGVIVPWTTPPLINAFLASTTPLRAVLCHIVMIAIDILIWLPFMYIYDRQLVASEGGQDIN